MWKSTPFWPLLCPDGRHLAPFMHAYHAFPYQVGMLRPGHSGNNIGDSLVAESSLLVIYCDFVHGNKWSSPLGRFPAVWQLVFSLVNHWRTYVARVTIVGLCVCASVHGYSGTTGNEAAYERYKRLS